MMTKKTETDVSQELPLGTTTDKACDSPPPPELANLDGDGPTEPLAKYGQISTHGIAVTDDGEFQNWLDSARFDHLWRIAGTFAVSELVPATFKGKQADCFIACQMAFRLKIDPFMFMQCCYVVSGKPGIEAKLVIALMNKRGPFRGPVQWEFAGEGNDRQCTAYAYTKVDGERCESTVTWKMVVAEKWNSKSGSKWMTLPDLMFQYRSAVFLARLFCPEVLMGMITTDEAQDIAPIIDEKPPMMRPRAKELPAVAPGAMGTNPTDLRDENLTGEST